MAHARFAFGVDAVGVVALCVLVAQMRRVASQRLCLSPPWELTTCVLRLRSGLTLAMHASRTYSDAKYLVSAAVLLTELLKLGACVAFAAARAPLAAALGLHLAPAPAGPAEWLAAAVDGAAGVVRGAGAVAVPAVLVRRPRPGKKPLRCRCRSLALR